MRKILPTALLIGFSASWFHCSSDETAKPKLRVGMLHWAAYGTLNVADKKGLWANEGVDVEVVNRVSNQELNADLTSGRIDVALDMMGSWVGIHLSGTPLKIIGETDWSYGGDQIIAKKTLDLTKLKGQSVAIYLDQPSVTSSASTSRPTRTHRVTPSSSPTSTRSSSRRRRSRTSSRPAPTSSPSTTSRSPPSRRTPPPRARS